MKNVICFHNPNEENAFLSNWFFSDFEKNGVKYSSMEQYMMHQKALTFKNMETAEKIMASSDYGEIKSLGVRSETMTTAFGAAFGRLLFMRDCWKSSVRILT